MKVTDLLPGEPGENRNEKPDVCHTIGIQLPDTTQFIEYSRYNFTDPDPNLFAGS